MKKVKRWRYYCDHCKKSGGSAYHMKSHEKRCTGNPERECGFCDIAGNIPYPKELLPIVRAAVAILEKSFSSKSFDSGIDIDEISNRVEKELLGKSGGCPACALAAIRQTKNSEFIQFDYKKAKAKFWKDNPRDEDLEYYP